MLAEIVPPAEERLAALHNLYNWTDWRALPMEERVMGIAWYRISRLIDLHQGDAVARDMERRQKQRTNGRVPQRRGR